MYLSFVVKIYINKYIRYRKIFNKVKQDGIMDEKVKTPPILLMAFKRPETTKKVFEKIREVRPKKFFFAVDGPRNEKEKRLVDQVKELAKLVDWKCDFKTNFKKENTGLKEGLIDNITWFFDHVDEGIILEDDCLVDSSFFRFCREMLDKYREDHRIMHIAGSNPHRGWRRNNYSYYFSHYTYSWGWATWKRAWKKIEADNINYNKIKEKGYLKDIYPKWYERMYLKKGFNLVYSDKLKSWDHHWLFTSGANSLLSIVPNKNLVKNIGIGPDASNTKGKLNNELSLSSHKMNFPLNHPAFVIRDLTSDNKYGWKLFRRGIRNNIFRILGISKFLG